MAMKHETMICPICKKEFNEVPALSRKDNKTLICPRCGRQEAIEAAYNYLFKKKEQ